MRKMIDEQGHHVLARVIEQNADAIGAMRAMLATFTRRELNLLAQKTLSPLRRQDDCDQVAARSVVKRGAVDLSRGSRTGGRAVP